MASTTRRLALGARHFSSRICIQRPASRFVPSWQQRPLSTTPFRRADLTTDDIKRELSEEDKEELSDLVEELEEIQDWIKDKDGSWKANDPDGLNTAALAEEPNDGFWSEGEPELADDDYYADDITSHGHGELEQHRELREYARLIAWELPLLNRTSLKNAVERFKPVCSS